MIVYGTDGRLKFDPKLGVYPPVGGGGVAVSAGTQSQSTGTVVFSNSNGISFGLNAGTLTASGGAGAATDHSHGNPTLALTNLTGTTASASSGLTLSLSAAAPDGGVAISASGGSASTGTVILSATASNSNSLFDASVLARGGVSFGMNGSTVTGDVATWYLREGTVRVLSGTSTDGASRTIVAPMVDLNAGPGNVTMALSSQQVTVGTDLYRTYQLYASVTQGAGVSHSHGNPTLALTNLTGTTASASNGLTISLSAAAPGAGGGFAAQGSGTYTQNTGTIQWANSNGITFGLSTNQMTASVNSTSNVGLGTALTAGPLAWTVNSGGISLNAGSAAGTSTGFAGANISMSMTHNTAGLNISASVAAPGGGAAYALYGQELVGPGGPPMVLITNLTATQMTNRILLFPFEVNGNLTCQELMWYMSRATSGSNLFTLSQAFYTFVNSSQISRMASTSYQYSATNTGSISGIRIFEVTPAQTTLSPGHYVLAMHFSGAATASINYSLMGHSTLNWAPAGVIHPGADQNTISANATSHQLVNFWGRHIDTTDAMPDTIGLSRVSGIGTFALPVKFWFGTHN